MINKYFLSALILSISIGAAAFIAVNGVSAQAPMVNVKIANIQYPVAELGNCGSEAVCKTYCDDAAHLSACISFGEKYKLMSQEEVQVAKKFAKAGGKGPGGCTGREDCNRYCDDVAHIDACITFAEQNGIMSGKELTEAKKVQAAIKKGVKPPACGGKQACDQYCSDVANMEECITFGQAAGLMGEKELQDSQKMLQAIKKGAKPPACKGQKECDTYCSDVAHMEECMTFAAAAGFMTEQEAQNSQKMLQAIKKGVKPPACKGKEECDRYCGEGGHMEECIAFSEAAGMMTPQEATMARKTGGKGPGECKNKDECEAFCNNQANQETCFNFGRDNGMIPPEELKKMEQGKQQFSQSINQAPPQVTECISNAVGADQFEKFKSGTAMPTRDIGDKIGNCLRQMMSPVGPGEGGNIPPGGQNGQFQPWADMCSNNTALACVDGAGEFVASVKVGSDGKPVCPANSTAKCGNYQQNNQQGQIQDQRGQFQPGPGATNPGGQMMPQQAGPGGCKTPEECKLYCASNPEACKNFVPSNVPGNMPSGQPQVQNQRCEGENCKQISPTGQMDVRQGTQQIINGAPGELRKTIEGAQGMMQGIQPGTPTQRQIPICAPGTQCPQGPKQVQQQMQQAQQEMQQFQQPPTGTGGSGGMMPPPSRSETLPPAPPSGGFLYKATQFFFGR